MPEESTTTHDAALAVLRAIVEEIKALAHDPKAVHFCAAKLHAGIDSLERALTQKSDISARTNVNDVKPPDQQKR